MIFTALPQAVSQEDNSARQRAAASLYELARDSFAKERYAEALDKLQEVYKLDPDPLILYNIGRCYEELGQLAKAAEFFQQAVADPDLPQRLQAEIGKRLPRVMPALQLQQARALSSQIVKQGFSRAGDAAVAEVMQRQKIVATPDPKIEEPKEQAPSYRPGILWGGVGAMALGAGLLAGGAVVDLGLGDSIDSLQDPATRRDQARTLALQQEIEDGQTLATLLYIGGGLAFVAGGLLTALSFGADASKEAAPESGAWRFAPVVGGRSVGVSLQGSFR